MFQKFMLWKSFSRYLAAVTSIVLLATTAQAVTIETVQIGNLDNKADSTGHGAVRYTYNIGKFEVTAAQYTAFLNAVAATDTYGLYNAAMVQDSVGCKIEQLGEKGHHTYRVAPEYANRPVNAVSWGDAARFVNWLHNGQPTGGQNASTTEDGAYALNGATTQAKLNAVTRKAGAKWFLPTTNEWYKAAYHKNDGDTGNYFAYPTSSNTPPIAIAKGVVANPDPGNCATYNNEGTMGLGSPYYRTEVGEHGKSASPYGTFDQGGNVWEWTESLLEANRDLRGGSAGRAFDNMLATEHLALPPIDHDSTVGFRVASIVREPEKRATSIAPSQKLPMPLLQPTDLTETSGVRLEVQVSQPAMVFFKQSSQPSTVACSPVDSHVLDDGTIQLWYLRVDPEATNYMDKLVLCLGEIRKGQWTLPAIHSEPPAWGGINNVVMTRSPHKPTWGGFNIFQITMAPDGALTMLYWDQPNETDKAGAMRAVSHDGKKWEKLPGTVFTEFNDAYSLTRIGNEYIVYQTALEPWPNKPFLDNLDQYKRVITLRTSPDLQEWSPQQPLLAPDSKDSPDTECYLLKAFPYGHGYGGLLWKYFADTTRPGKHSRVLRTELVVSEDGHTWQRPYRDADLGFWTSAEPFTIDNRLHFATWKEGAMMTVAWGQDRLIAAAGEGSFSTRPFLRSQKGIALNADASSGWIEATLCNSAGNPIPNLSSHRITSIEGKSIPLPWKDNALPKECSLRIRLGGGAKVFGITEQPPA